MKGATRAIRTRAIRVPEGIGAHRYGERWNEAENGFLRENYQQGVTNAQLAALMGVSRRALMDRAVRLGLMKRTDARRWSAGEEERLVALVGRVTAGQAALELGRSVRAVRQKASRLRVFWEDHDGWYSAKEVSRVLGGDDVWVARRIRSGALPAEKTGPRSRDAWRVREKDLRDFLRRYPHELEGRDVDLVQIVQILAGLDYPEGGRG